jgi:hypothetical protein
MNKKIELLVSDGRIEWSINESKVALQIDELIQAGYDNKTNSVLVMKGPRDHESLSIYGLDGSYIKDVAPPQDFYFYLLDITQNGIDIVCSKNERLNGFFDWRFNLTDEGLERTAPFR